MVAVEGHPDCCEPVGSAQICLYRRAVRSVRGMHLVASDWQRLLAPEFFELLTERQGLRKASASGRQDDARQRRLPGENPEGWRVSVLSEQRRACAARKNVCGRPFLIETSGAATDVTRNLTFRKLFIPSESRCAGTIGWVLDCFWWHGAGGAFIPQLSFWASTQPPFAMAHRSAWEDISAASPPGAGSLSREHLSAYVVVPGCRSSVTRPTRPPTWVGLDNYRLST